MTQDDIVYVINVSKESETEMGEHLRRIGGYKNTRRNEEATSKDDIVCATCSKRTNVTSAARKRARV